MANKELTSVMSTIVRVRQDDGSFIPVFPISTTDEVYVDIDNDIKLSTYLDGILKSKNVDNMDALYSLTSDDVNLNDFIKTIDENRYFIVIDINNLNSESGYLEILTVENLGKPNGLPQLNEEGKLPLENVEPSIEFITYSRSN